MTTDKAVVDAALAGVRWELLDKPDGMTDDALFATHAGETAILGVRMRCFRLNDGRAVFHADDMMTLLDAIVTP